MSLGMDLEEGTKASTVLTLVKRKTRTASKEGRWTTRREGGKVLGGGVLV